MAGSAIVVTGKQLSVIQNTLKEIKDSIHGFIGALGTDFTDNFSRFYDKASFTGIEVDALIVAGPPASGRTCQKGGRALES